MSHKSRSGNQYVEPPTVSNGGERQTDHNNKTAVILWDESERPCRSADEPTETPPAAPKPSASKTGKENEKQS